MDAKTLEAVRTRDQATFGAALHEMNVGQLVQAISDRHQLLSAYEKLPQNVTIERCKAGHDFARGPSHPWRYMPMDHSGYQCPHCMILELEKLQALYSSQPMPITTDELARLIDVLHEKRAHPDFEYETTTCARKSGMASPPDGDGWVPNEYGGDGHSSWDRFDYHENHYWRRRRPVMVKAEEPATPEHTTDAPARTDEG